MYNAKFVKYASKYYIISHYYQFAHGLYNYTLAEVFHFLFVSQVN